MNSWFRYLLVLALLSGTAVFLRIRGGPEKLPARLPLISFPMQFDEWQGQGIAIEPEVLKILGDGEFIQRIYFAPAKPYVDFFVAYFPTQRTGSTIHSPQNCLPGSGWTPIESRRIQIEGPGRSPITVNRYLIAKGGDQQLVIYWYQSNGRVEPSEYWSKIYMVTDSIRRNRSDGALVRIVTPVLSNENTNGAQNRATGFARQVIPLLDAYVPR